MSEINTCYVHIQFVLLVVIVMPDYLCYYEASFGGAEQCVPWAYRLEVEHLQLDVIHCMLKAFHWSEVKKKFPVT